MNVVGVILAAGFGMRLRPSTERCPKPLIPVGGIEPLFFALYRFYELGIRRVVVNAHHLSGQIEDSLRKWEKMFDGFELRVSFEKSEILGTGGALIKIVQENKDWFPKNKSALLLQNGDTLAHFDFRPLLANKEQSTFAVSYLKTHLQKYNPLWLDPKNRNWAGIGKVAPQKDLLPAHFLGVHYLAPSAINRLQDPKEFKIEEIDLFNGVYRPLVNSGLHFESRESIHEGNVENFWFDMTTPEFLLEAQRHVLESYKVSTFWGELLQKRYPGIREVEPGVWLCQKQAHSACSYHAPAVWVEKEGKTQPQRERGLLVLGPHASLISEGNHFGGQVAQGEVRIRNAVVFLSGEGRDFVPENLSDALCVL